MRIKKMHASADDDDDDDDVQIVYEGPIDEDCQILEVVNPPLVDAISSSSALLKASGSRTSVISKRKHSDTDTLQSPSKTSVIKHLALQGNLNETEQTIPINLTQPSTSQMPIDYLENINLSQQPSTSGQVTIDSLNPGSQASNGDNNSCSINSISILKKVSPIHKHLKSSESPHRIISALEKSSSSHPFSPREMKMRKIIIAFQNRLKIRRMRRTERTASRSDAQTVLKNNNSNPSVEGYVHHESPSVSLTSQPSTSAIQEIGDIANNTDFSSAALITHQVASEQNSPQQQVKLSNNEVILQNYNNDHSYSSPADMNRLGELEQPPSTQPNIRNIQEVNNLAFNPSPTLVSRQTTSEQQQASPSNVPTAPHESCNLLEDYSFLTHFVKFILRANTSCIRQQAMTMIQQPSIQGNINIPSEAPINQQQDHSEQQVAGIATQSNIINTRVGIPLLQNQVIQSTAPPDLIQEINSHGQGAISQQEISSIGLNNSTMVYLDTLNEQKHAIWNGTVECYEKRNGSSVKLSLPFNCTISVVATIVRNNESASFWPCQLVLHLHPVDLSLRMDVLKKSKRVVTLDFHQESEFRSILQGTVTGSGHWIGLIELPASSYEEKIIVIYVPLKKIYLGFVANADSSFIQRITQTSREFNSENQSQPAVSMFETLGQNTYPCTSVRPSQQRFVPSVSHTSPELSIQRASVIPSSATSLPQPVHLQTNFPQPLYQPTSLSQPVHPQISLPQPVLNQTSLPQPVLPQTSLPQPVLPQTRLPQPVLLQTSLPQLVHPQTSLPQPMHPQTSLPQPMHPQISLPQFICMPPIILTQQRTLHRCSRHHTCSKSACPCQQTNFPQNGIRQCTCSISACPYQQTNLPQTSQQRAISYHVGGSLEVPLQTRFGRGITTRPRTVNKYETVDRHIDAYISALRQNANKSVQSASASTSQQAQTPTEQQQTRVQIHIEETGTEGTRTNNEQMQLSIGGESSQSNEASSDQDSILVQSQASEIFSKSVVKKVVRKILKETGKQFKSAHELCEAILEYEERKQKHKVEKKLKSDVNEALLCKICMDQQMNIVFEPCGHLATCETCAQPLNKCPMCRSAIAKNRKIYMS